MRVLREEGAVTVIVERFSAIVTRLADDSPPRGRVFVKCADITGDDEQELPDAIEPVWQWGWFTVPDVGEEIEIEAVTSDETTEDVPNQAFIDEPRFRWTGRRFASEEGEAPRPPNAIFTATNHGKRRGFATPTGHFLVFDDTEGAERILLAWTRPSDGGTAFLDFQPNGSIVIQNRTGSTIFFNAEAGEFMIIDEHGNVITTRSAGVAIIDRHGNTIETTSASISVNAQGDTLINAGSNVTVQAGADVTVQSGAARTVNVNSQGGTVNVDGATVNVRGAQTTLGAAPSSPVARFVELQASFDTHIHLTAFGPSSPPVVPLLPAVASATVTVS
jgi:hypothetical protein